MNSDLSQSLTKSVEDLLGSKESEEVHNNYVGDIEDVTLSNKDFRHVLNTTKLTQLVVMYLKPGQEIGEEIHPSDQFFRIESGEGTVVLDDVEHDVRQGDAIIVPAGTKHNVINSAEGPMKLYTLYAPPMHKPGTVHKTKEDAEKDEGEE